MNKLFFATCTILFPLVGCTGMVGETSGAFDGGAGGATSAGASSASAPGTGGSGTSGATGAAASAGVGTGGVDAGGGGTTASGNGGACSVEALPADVQTLLNNKCATCHGATPLAGLPSLVSYAAMTAPSKTDPTKTNAALALIRMQSTQMPMPPAPGSPATASDIAALQAFVSQGYPKPTCPTGGGGAGGTGGGAGGAPGTMDPLLAAATCTSMSTWKSGNKGSGSMNPGMACISCHSMGGDGPGFSIAGTVYPTGHEPDKCNSLVGADGARIVIIGADGKMVTLTPNSAGNFYSSTAIKTPYQAKVTYQGRERLMQAMQTSGDCNSCHTQDGTKMAPGRITIP